jgi:hypothetical protein
LRSGDPPGADVMILKIFSPKHFAKKLAFLIQNKAKMMGKIDRNIGFCEKRHFFAENSRKSQKIVIVTSTPVADPTNFEFTNTTPALK